MANGVLHRMTQNLTVLSAGDQFQQCGQHPHTLQLTGCSPLPYIFMAYEKDFIQSQKLRWGGAYSADHHSAGSVQLKLESLKSARSGGGWHREWRFY